MQSTTKPQQTQAVALVLGAVDPTTGHTLFWIMAGGELVGHLNYRPGPQPPEVGNIGYRVHPRYRGHGYARRACEALAALLAVDTLRIACHRSNTPSRRTIEALGATLETQTPSHLVYRWDPNKTTL